MYSSLGVSNFRGLRHLVATDLGRVNLIVGTNNVGKTSLLEALSLLQGAGNPVLTLVLAAFRGFSPGPQTPDLLWHTLFSNMDVTDQIEIVGQVPGGSAESLSIAVRNEWVEGTGPNDVGTALPVPFQVAEITVSVPETLYFQFQTDGTDPIVSTFSLGLGRASARANPELANRPAVFLPSHQAITAAEVPARFTRAQDTVGIGPLVESLRVLEPSLESLSIGVGLQDRQPRLRAHVGLSRPLPLPLLGGGAVRLTEVILALLTGSDGLVLVDEIESGLYHRNMEAAWQAIDIASRTANAQMFATTHSRECVEAAVAAFAGDSAGDFRLYRIERDGDGVRAVVYDHETAHAALDMNLAFR